MAFTMGADELVALARFLVLLREASQETGVKISHYERVELETPSGETIHMAGSCDDDKHYALEERDAS